LRAIAWIESLSPWPEEFGLERMRVLLAALGDPQRELRAVHVVGSNGKSTATRTVEALLAADGLQVGAYLSPHVRDWSERIRVGGEEADFETAIERVRDEAERLDATQFEVLTAAALCAFADAEVDAAVVEAGLGGRHDATNVLDAPVVLLTNVGLEHTDVLGSTRQAIAREKLAVVRQGATVVLPDEEFAALVPHARIVLGAAREATEAFLGHPVDADVHVALPGRFEWRGPNEIWDGAHNADGLDWLLPRLPPGRYTVVASILRDKRAGAMLDRLARVAGRLIATSSTNPRALPAEDLAELAQGRIASVEAVPDPAAALERAREDPPVLVTGSLYLFADLVSRQDRRVK
jgi:dihydrofolate synthase/folylpolyglutamate synthase